MTTQQNKKKAGRASYKCAHPGCKLVPYDQAFAENEMPELAPAKPTYNKGADAHAAGARPQKPSRACKLHNGNHPYVTCPKCEHQYCQFYWPLCPRCNPDVEPAPSAGQNREVGYGEDFRHWIKRLKLVDNHDNWEEWAAATPANPAPHAAGAHMPLIATTKVDKWLNELRQILVDRSEFKLADHVVSARVVIKMLERNNADTAAERDRLRERLAEVSRDYAKVVNYASERDQAREQVKALLAVCKDVVYTWEHDFKGQDTGFENTPLEADYKRCKAAIAAVESEGQ